MGPSPFDLCQGRSKWTNEVSNFTNDDMVSFDGGRRARQGVLFMCAYSFAAIVSLKRTRKLVPSLPVA